MEIELTFALCVTLRYYMKKAATFFLLFLLLTDIYGGINPFAKWTKTELILCNGIVRRTIRLPSDEGRFVTVSYKPVNGSFSYLADTCSDFMFELNGTSYSGRDIWKLVTVQVITDENEGSGAAVTIRSHDMKVEVTLRFLLYPDSPVVRKNLVVKNLGDEVAKLESVDIEKLEVPGYYPVTYSWIYTDYGRRRHLGNYDGNKQDALIIVHDMNREEGIVLGNEATGVMKHTSLFYETQDICLGLTHKNSPFPFRKWIEKGQLFETPQVFTLVYNHQKTIDNILNLAVPDFVRKYMGISLSGLAEKPTFVYNTWEPFYKNLNEKLIMELAKAAADAGMKEFVIDDGWQDSYGDWGIDYTKFPNGLKPVFDYIKSLGMKPGLWVSIGSASPESKVYLAHPEWFVTDISGKPASLHMPGDKEKYTACFGTGWYDYIKNILMKLSVDYGLEYFKLDFAVVTSAYTYDHTQSGCYSLNHPGHKDHNESLFTNYERLWQLFDELHKAKPGLFIDCTFETMGGTQLIDYALLKHAEGDWLSNFEGAAGEKTAIRIRNMAWWRSPAISATSLVIGNPQMQDMAWETHIKSIAGALPIMLGDPRALSGDDLVKYRAYSDWLKRMENRYSIMSYRQDLPGFGEPMEGMWDGFQRINTENRNGGIIGIFRHGSVESKRIVTVKYLNPLMTYEVKSTDGKVNWKMTGKELEENGFSVELPSLYSGELFEISEKK
jgi:alpha-galactosidase